MSIVLSANQKDYGPCKDCSLLRAAICSVEEVCVGVAYTMQVSPVSAWPHRGLLCSSTADICTSLATTKLDEVPALMVD